MIKTFPNRSHTKYLFPLVFATISTILSGCHAPTFDEYVDMIVVSEEGFSRKELAQNREYAEELAILCGIEEGCDPSKIVDKKERQKLAAKGLARLEQLAQGEKDNGKAAAILGYICYFSGEYEKGVFWARKAAEQGYLLGTVVLAHAYDFGNGVEKDFEEVTKWMMIRGRANDELGKYNIKKMKKEADCGSAYYARCLKQADLDAEAWINSHQEAFQRLQEQIIQDRQGKGCR